MTGRFDQAASTVVGRVLVVDDEPAIAAVLERLLVSLGYIVFTARDGEEALEAVSALRPDVVLSDVRMPRCDGFELCHRLKGDPLTRLTPVVLMTGAAEAEDRLRAIEAGADDFLRKPVDAQELRARIRSLVRLKRFTDELESAEQVILSLALTVEARDRHTYGHCERLAAYTTMLGGGLELPVEDVEALRRGAYVHDLGKIAIPDAILLKPGPLTPDERAVVQQHPVVGDRLCGGLKSFQRVRPIVRHHHERLDGSGYPDGLVGDDVPQLAQVLAVADVYDAVTTRRPYKPALPAAEALAILREEVRRGWKRAALVEAFARLSETGELDRAAAIVAPPGSDSDGPLSGER